jgi:hypothetical protein
VRVPGAGRLTATATRGGRKVASGAKSVHGRNGAVKLRFTKQAKRSLKRASSVTVRLTVKFKPHGGKAKRTAVSLTLNR